MILLHFPKEGIEHRELMALMRGNTINKNYFDEEMWKPLEFESVHTCIRNNHNMIIAESDCWPFVDYRYHQNYTGVYNRFVTVDSSSFIHIQHSPKIRVYKCRFDNANIWIDKVLGEKCGIWDEYCKAQADLLDVSTNAILLDEKVTQSLTLECEKTSKTDGDIGNTPILLCDTCDLVCRYSVV